MSETKEKSTTKTKKKTTGEKSSAANKTVKKETTAKKKQDQPKAKKMTKAEMAEYEKEQARIAAENEARAKEIRAIKDDIFLIISIAIAALLVLSNFKLSGVAGEMVNGALFGLFGWLAYLVPLFIVVCVGFFLANRGNKKRRYIPKFIASFLIFVFLAAIIQGAVGDVTEEMSPMDYYEYAKAHKSGGGLVGGIICSFLVHWFDVIGSYIILATLELICIFFVTGKALLRSMTEGLHERNEEKARKRKELDELYEDYLSSEEAEDYLENSRASVESMLPGGDREERIRPAAEMQQEETAGRGLKMAVDYDEAESDAEEREFEESLKKSHLRKEKKEKTGKINFFGGRTETKPYSIPKAEEAEAAAAETERTEIALSEDPVEIIEDNTEDNDSIYESELDKKFSGKKELKETTVLNRRAISIFKPRAEEKEYVTDGEDDYLRREYEEDRYVESLHGPDEDEGYEDMYESTYTDPFAQEDTSYVPVEEKPEVRETEPEIEVRLPEDIFDEEPEKIDLSYDDEPEVRDYSYVAESFDKKEEKKEISFSETALKDKSEFNYSKDELAKTMDSVPYALSSAANKPLNYHKDAQPIALRDEQKTAAGQDIGLVEEKNNQMAIKPMPKPYEFPPIELLEAPVRKNNQDNSNELAETAEKLQKTLDSFGVRVTISNVQRGPSVTRYEIQPEVGVKVSRITNLADDIKLNLAAADIRIEAPIPGKAAVGIEVPNRENTMVTFRELVESDEFANAKGKIPFTVGKSIDGANIIGDIAKMPHLMIAGSTGSGKSVCINTIIMSILYEFKPEDVKLIMIDPKVVELSVYNGIPHLLIPVVTDPKKAAAALNWACVEMDERYKKFAELSVRDLKGYNEKVKAEAERGHSDPDYPVMPQMVIIVDELADLMMVASNEVEDSICRLAQKARACGMHLIIATQRPSVNVITGLIKANIPSRIAFAVSSGVDSRTILDNVGAEKLLGKGDMLYYPTGMTKPVRIQGCFVSDKDVNAVVDFIRRENEPAVYNESINEKIARSNDEGKAAEAKGAAQSDDGRDEYFEEAGRLIIEKEKASIGMLQRAYKVGFNRAARIMDQLAEAGVVSEEDGNKPRQILMTAADYEAMLRNEQ